MLKMKKSVLITGCSKGGIGDALAQEFHNKGLRVFATARDLAKVEHLKAMGLEVLQLDVTSQESIQNAMDEVQKAAGGKLDFLVNNAGSGKCLTLGFQRNGKSLGLMLKLILI
jgi:1-acylglycerone phosphate reductase